MTLQEYLERLKAAQDKALASCETLNKNGASGTEVYIADAKADAYSDALYWATQIEIKEVPSE
jgi:hypothetical protein